MTVAKSPVLSTHQFAVSSDQVRVLIVVEGTNDIEFLRRISVLLSSDDPSLPNLADMERTGELIFLPFGGGHVRAWMHRLAPLGKPEFHLYDHELPPETDHRRQAVAAVNRRPRCEATLTRKRSLENYLHPQAIHDVGKISIDFGDFDPVAENAARHLHERGLGETPWALLSRRARSRSAHQAKRWLNTRAVNHMTTSLLSERDPDAEVVSWLKAIGRLADED